MAGLVCAGVPALHPSYTTYDLAPQEQYILHRWSICIRAAIQETEGDVEVLKSVGLKGVPSPFHLGGIDFEKWMNMQDHARSCKIYIYIYIYIYLIYYIYMRKKTIENTWAVWCIGQKISNHDISRFLRLMRLWCLFERVKRARCTNSFHRLSPGVASKIQNMGAMRLGSKQSRKSVFWFPSIVNNLFFRSCQPFGAQHYLGDLSRDWFANCACGCWLLPAMPTWSKWVFPLCSFLWDPLGTLSANVCSSTLNQCVRARKKRVKLKHRIENQPLSSFKRIHN